MSNYLKNFMGIIGVTTFAIIFLAIFNLFWSWPLMLSWNYVMPSMFGLKEIGYWQMWCMCYILVSLWKITPITVQQQKNEGS